MARVSQPVSMPCWYAGFGSTAEQPEPPDSQAVSVQPRAVVSSRVSVVPPTATIFPFDAGQLTTLP